MLAKPEGRKAAHMSDGQMGMSERNNIREGGRGRGAVQIAQSVSVYSRDAEVREEGRPEDPKTSSSMVQTTDRHPEA